MSSEFDPFFSSLVARNVDDGWHVGVDEALTEDGAEAAGGGVAHGLRK